MASTDSKKYKLYSICKNLVSIILTLLLMLPIIYLIGVDESFHNNRPLYSAYTKDKYFQQKIAEVQSALNTTNIVNILIKAEKVEKVSQVNDWDNLKQFKEYIGFYLNSKGYKTLDRLIVPPLILSKKGKKSNPAQNQKLLQAAYSLQTDDQITFLSNHLGKFASNTISRLKLRAKKTKQNTFTERIKNSLVQQFSEGKIWIITIDAGSWQNHSSEELKKQVNTILKQRPNDKFVVFSVGAVDSNWKKVKNIIFKIDQGVLGNMKNSLNEVVKTYLSFKLNATKFVQTILCSSKASLFKLDNFINNCNSTFSCYRSIQILSDPKNNKEFRGKLRPYLQELCERGRISEDNQEIFLQIINQLGFYDLQLTQDLQQQIKTYYQIGTNKYCKGTERCNFKWLKTVKQEKINKTLSSIVKQSLNESDNALKASIQDPNDKKEKETAKQDKEKSGKQSKKLPVEQVKKLIEEETKKQPKKNKETSTKIQKKDKEAKSSTKAYQKQTDSTKNKNKGKANKQAISKESGSKKNQKKTKQIKPIQKSIQKQSLVSAVDKDVQQIINDSIENKKQVKPQVNEIRDSSEQVESEQSKLEINQNQSAKQIDLNVSQEDDKQTKQSKQQENPAQSLIQEEDKTLETSSESIGIQQIKVQQKKAEIEEKEQAEDKPAEPQEQIIDEVPVREEQEGESIKISSNNQQVNDQTNQKLKAEQTQNEAQIYQQVESKKQIKQQQPMQTVEQADQQSKTQDQSEENKDVHIENKEENKQNQVKNGQQVQIILTEETKNIESHEQNEAKQYEQEIKQKLPENNNALNIQSSNESQKIVETIE